MQPLRVMGGDPGRRHIGYAVIAERLLTAGVWQFPAETPALLLPALVRQRAQTLLRRYQVEVPAIEDWVWHGRFVSEAPSVTPGRKRLRTPEQALRAWEQATRQCWRDMALIIKAKLEAVASGVTTFEDEFSSRFMLPNGNTVGQWLHPQLAQAYEMQRMPPMLPLPEPHE